MPQEQNKEVGINHKERGILVRCDHAWQKKELEEAARKDGRSLSQFVLREIGKRRKWKDRDPATGEVLP